MTKYQCVWTEWNGIKYNRTWQNRTDQNFHSENQDYLACPHYFIIHAISLFLCDFMIWHLEIHLHINYTIFPFSSFSCFPVSFCILMSQICPPLSLCCSASAQHEPVYATCTNHCSSTGTNGDRKHSANWLAETWEMATGRTLPPKWDVALLPSVICYV